MFWDSRKKCILRVINTAINSESSSFESVGSCFCCAPFGEVIATTDAVKHFILAFVVVAALSVPVRADTFDFSFATLDGEFSGVGSFNTYAFSTQPDGMPSDCGCYVMESLSGEVDGIAVVLVDGSAMQYEGPIPPVVGVPLILFENMDFLQQDFAFLLDSQEYHIHVQDMGPSQDLGLNLYGPGYQDQVMLGVVPTPEPSTSLLLIFCIAPFLFAARKIRFRG